MTQQKYRVVVSSPHGRQSIEEWVSEMNKMAEKARAEHGIRIALERVEREELDTAFRSASEHG